jgi:hypothetical protein
MAARPVVSIEELSFQPTEAPLFWIELAFMVVISIRFVRGSLKLRSYIDLETPETNEKLDKELQAETD